MNTIAYSHRIGTFDIFQPEISFNLTFCLLSLCIDNSIPTTCCFYYQSLFHAAIFFKNNSLKRFERMSKKYLTIKIFHVEQHVLTPVEDNFSTISIFHDFESLLVLLSRH